MMSQVRVFKVKLGLCTPVTLKLSLGDTQA